MQLGVGFRGLAGSGGGLVGLGLGLVGALGAGGGRALGSGHRGVAAVSKAGGRARLEALGLGRLAGRATLGTRAGGGRGAIGGIVVAIGVVVGGSLGLLIATHISVPPSIVLWLLWLVWIGSVEFISGMLAVVVGSAARLGGQDVGAGQGLDNLVLVGFSIGSGSPDMGIRVPAIAAGRWWVERGRIAARRRREMFGTHININPGGGEGGIPRMRTVEGRLRASLSKSLGVRERGALGVALGPSVGGTRRRANGSRGGVKGPVSSRRGGCRGKVAVVAVVEGGRARRHGGRKVHDGCVGCGREVSSGMCGVFFFCVFL